MISQIMPGFGPSPVDSGAIVLIGIIAFAVAAALWCRTVDWFYERTWSRWMGKFTNRCARCFHEDYEHDPGRCVGSSHCACSGFVQRPPCEGGKR